MRWGLGAGDERWEWESGGGWGGERVSAAKWRGGIRKVVERLGGR